MRYAFRGDRSGNLDPGAGHVVGNRIDSTPNDPIASVHLIEARTVARQVRTLVLSSAQQWMRAASDPGGKVFKTVK
ncbi:MAG: hypothetical protein ACREVA_00120 [Burkholderiales bacterium]